MSEPLIQLLAELPSAEPDPTRAERIRMGCRARLRHEAPGASAPRRRRPPVQLWQPLIVVLGVAYLTEVVVQALRVYGRLSGL